MKHFLYKHNFTATIFIFGFMWFFSILPFESDFIDPVSEAVGDFEITDMVFSNGKLRDPNPPADDRILLVDVGNLTRKELAEEIRVINKYQPKAIGIDLFFRKTQDDEQDTALANAFSEVKNLVLVTKCSNLNKDETEFDSLETSNPIFMNNANTGFANLITDADLGSGYGSETFKTCRSFTPTEIVNGKQELAFAVKLSQFYNTDSTNIFLQRKNLVEDINFSRRVGNYWALNVDQVFNEQFLPERVKDKIVIFGILKNFYNKNDIEDMFFTPMNKSYAGKAHLDMNGVVIHANIITMILNKDYINHTADWITTLIAVLYCFLNVVLFNYINNYLGTWYDALTKVLQLIQSILLIACQVIVFWLHNLKIDLTLTVVAVALAGDLLEVYHNVFVDLYHKIKSKLIQPIILKTNKPTQ